MREEELVREKMPTCMPVQGRNTPKISMSDNKAIKPVRLNIDICLWKLEEKRGDSGYGSESGLWRGLWCKKDDIV